MPEARSTVTYREAVIEALREEMRADPSVFVIGEDVGAAGGVFHQTQGLFEEFGPQRVIDTPISEAGSFGMAVGAAMAGMRPVFEVMFNDFMTLVMDSLVNQAAKVHYMSGGHMSVPMVLRTTMGMGASLGAQHSQVLYAWAAHVPGLKVLVPSCACDAKGLYKAAIRDNGPVVIFEDRLLYGAKSEVGNEPIPMGRADIKRRGRDATVVAVGRMVPLALAAARELAEKGIEVEVVDPRTLLPLDIETIVESVKRTHRALVVDGGHRAYGAGAEIAATIAQEAFDWLDAPVTRLGAADVPIPFSRSLESGMLPTTASIARSLESLCSRQ
jgi:pyruvate/2-oxoglutarate/acetoin dehydrogenase E1 component